MDASTVGTCHFCGAQLFPREAWCGLCLNPRDGGAALTVTDVSAIEEPEAAPWPLADILPVLLAGLGFGSLLLLLLTEWFNIDRGRVLAFTLLLPGAGLTVITLYWLRFIRHASPRIFGWPRSFWKDVGIGVGVGLVTMPIAGLVTQATLKIFDPSDRALPGLTNPTGAEKVILVIALVLVAPIGEEIFFRGFLYGGLRRRTRVIGASAASAAVFASLHFPAWRAPGVFVIGLVLAALYERRRNLVVCIAAHAANNLVVVVVLLSTSFR